MDQDTFFQALSNSYRREILRLLHKGEMCAGDIAQQFQISQPSISRHLDLLRRSGLVVSRRQANQILYALDPVAEKKLSSWLEGFPF